MLKRQIARDRLDVARLASTQRIQESAAQLGLVLPAPGEVRYLKARPRLDAHMAAKRMTAPNLAVRAAAAGGHRAGAPAADHRHDPAADHRRRAAATDPAAADPATADPAAAAPRPRPPRRASPCRPRSADPPTRRPRRGPGLPPTRLVERRIGLLFAMFLLLLALAALRATWLGTVRSGSLSRRAP